MNTAADRADCAADAGGAGPSIAPASSGGETQHRIRGAALAALAPLSAFPLGILQWQLGSMFLLASMVVGAGTLLLYRKGAGHFTWSSLWVAGPIAALGAVCLLGGLIAGEATSLIAEEMHMSIVDALGAAETWDTLSATLWSADVWRLYLYDAEVLLFVFGGVAWGAYLAL